MLIILLVVIYLLYKVYRKEKQKSHDFDVKVDWFSIVKSCAIILGVISLVFFGYKNYMVFRYMNSDSVQRKEIRTLLTGTWELTRRYNFKDAKIKTADKLTFGKYFRRFPGMLIPEAYGVEVLNPDRSSIQEQEIYLQYPNNAEFGSLFSQRILKLNRDTLIINYPSFVNSNEKGVMAIYKKR